MSTPITQPLAEFAAEIRLDDVPESTRQRAKDLLLDAVGCSVAGHEGEETSQIEGFVARLGEEGDSTVIGRADPLGLVGATLLNAYLSTAVTVCDVYVPSHCHITPEIVPPALAVAEQRGAGGEELLEALVVGLEVTSRVARGLNYPEFRARGWHAPGVIGPFGAGAAVARLLGADATQMRNVLGLAGSQSAGTWAAWGTPTVKFHQARGAVSGLLAGFLGMEGFLASPEILTHPDGGILTTYAGGGLPDAVVSNLGGEWELEQISLRRWPGGTPLQTAITAIGDLQEGGWSAPIDAIERVVVSVAPNVHEAHARFVEPDGKFQALLSFHFVSTLMLHGKELWLDTIGPEYYADPGYQAFMRDRIEVVADDRLTPVMCRVEITHDGTTTIGSVDRPKGHPDRPLTQGELTDKFRLCLSGRLEGADAIAERFIRLEEEDDVAGLMQALRPGG